VFFHQAGDEIGRVRGKQMAILPVGAGKESGVIEAGLVLEGANSTPSFLKDMIVRFRTRSFSLPPEKGLREPKESRNPSGM
jgi:hypothetical protein